MWGQQAWNYHRISSTLIRAETAPHNMVPGSPAPSSPVLTSNMPYVQAQGCCVVRTRSHYLNWDSPRSRCRAKDTWCVWEVKKGCAEEWRCEAEEGTLILIQLTVLYQASYRGRKRMLNAHRRTTLRVKALSYLYPPVAG